MFSRRHGASLASLLFAAALLSSCVGVDATATLAADGAGTLAMRYSVSKMFATLGALEANERFIPFPVSNDDFERTVRGIEGLKLVSHNLKETADDLVADVALSFASPAALCAFLDPKAERAAFSEEGGRRRLRLVLAGGIKTLDPDVEKLVDTAFAPYRIALTLKLPSPALSAGIGKASSGGVQLDYAAPVTALAKSRDPIVWEVTW